MATNLKEWLKGANNPLAVQLFIRFLLENNIYLQFVQNFYDREVQSYPWFYERLVPSRFIDNAFSWSHMKDEIRWGCMSLSWQLIVLSLEKMESKHFYYNNAHPNKFLLFKSILDYKL